MEFIPHPNLNLDSLRSEIQNVVAEHGLAVFHGLPRGVEHASAVYWDTDRDPDYRKFVSAAQASGAKLVTIYANEFSEDTVEEALERLEASSLSREERRGMESRLRELRAYAGFICQIELSFDLAPRVYIFDLRTGWLEELNDMLDRIDDAYEAEDDEDAGGEEPLGGYFSRN